MKNKFRMAAIIALALTLIAATIAFADDLLSDGDGLVPVVDTPTLALGNVCTGTTTSKPIAHVISRGGGGGITFANSATVAVSVTSYSGIGLSASGGGNIGLPSNWVSRADGTKSASVTSSIITFVAGSTPRSFSGTVNYQAVGPRSTSGTLTRTDSITVTATVINCDTTPPTLNLPANMTVEATGSSGAVATFSATATDTNPLSPVVSCVPASGATFGFGTTTVNCSATDAAGNTANGSFTVTVVDTTPPTVTPPSNITMEATSGSGAVVTYSGESASDLVDGALLASCSPASGSTFPLGLNTVTCSATDSHSNTGSSSFTIDVQDTTAPILALPSDITAEATGASGAAVNFSTSASDLVDGSVAVSCNWNDGDTFPLGTTLVSCSATDSNSNTSSGSFNVIVVDTTAPSLTLPTNISLEATSASGAVATFSASATDLVDGSVAVACVLPSGSTFPLGTTTVNCSATDAHSNTATGSFDVTVVDTTPPSLTLPADQQLEATGPSGAVAIFSASAFDAVDGTLTVSCSATSGATFPLGTTTVNCSVSDAAGNTASGSFIIIVEDTTAPVITFVSRTAANGNGWNNGNVTVNWSCTDIVGVASPTVSVIVSTEGTNQSATGICTDTSGNTASDTQIGINIDKTKPSASASRTPAANSNGWNNSDVTVSFSGTDDRSGIHSCSADQVFGEGAGQSASGTCTDMAGNVSDAATVNDINVDKTAPTISGAPDRAANANGWYNANVTVSFTCSDALSGVDDCSTPTTLGEGASQSVLGSVTDKAGNTANDTVSDINIDKTAPSISAALDRSPAGTGWFNIATGAPNVDFTCSDALSGLAGACPASHLFGDGENQSYSQTIYDLAGNSASDGETDVDVDTVAPSISASISPTLPSSGWWNIASGAPTVSFACADATSSVLSCPSSHMFGEGEDQAYSATAYDFAGNSATDGVSNIDVDLTAPSISATLDRSRAGSGWFNISTGVPTVEFTCSDALSDIGTCPANFTFGDGADQSHSGIAYDNAGNSASAGVSNVDVDTVAPSISASISPALPSSGWWNIASGAPTVTYNCSDGTSGIASCTAPFTFPEGADQNHAGTAVDNAGNSNATGVNSIYVDLTAPSLTWNIAIISGDAFYFGSVPAYPPNPCVASDALSGANGCAVIGYGTTVGIHTMTATAHDVAGNAYNEYRTYTVNAWTLKGFYQPVDMNGVYNVVKGGSTVPLKFEIFAGLTELTDVSAVQSLTYAQILCNGTSPQDEIETVATGGTVLRYDATGGQFIFNWKTPATPGKCYRVTMTTDDGSSLVAYFKIK